MEISTMLRWSLIKVLPFESSRFLWFPLATVSRQHYFSISEQHPFSLNPHIRLRLSINFILSASFNSHCWLPSDSRHIMVEISREKEPSGSNLEFFRCVFFFSFYSQVVLFCCKNWSYSSEYSVVQCTWIHWIEFHLKI